MIKLISLIILSPVLLALALIWALIWCTLAPIAFPVWYILCALAGDLDKPKGWQGPFRAWVFCALPWAPDEWWRSSF